MNRRRFLKATAIGAGAVAAAPLLDLVPQAASVGAPLTWSSVDAFAGTFQAGDIITFSGMFHVNPDPSESELQEFVITDVVDGAFEIAKR